MKLETGHVTDAQLAALLGGEASASAEEHLRLCAPCRLELDRTGQFLTALRGQVHAGANRPDAFWKYQVHATLARQQTPPAPWKRALASAALLAVLAMGLFLGSRQPEVAPLAGIPDARIAQATELSDAQILSEVERTLQSAPAALQPAALIAEELLVSTRDTAPAQVQPAQIQKEKRDEI